MIEEEIQRGTKKKRETNEMRKQNIAEKESFQHKRQLRQDHLIDKIRSGTIFYYVQCDIKLFEHLRDQIAIFPLKFKNTNVYRQDIGPPMHEYAEKEG